jgi:hypothetical protein
MTQLHRREKPAVALDRHGNPVLPVKEVKVEKKVEEKPEPKAKAPAKKAASKKKAKK